MRKNWLMCIAAPSVLVAVCGLMAVNSSEALADETAPAAAESPRRLDLPGLRYAQFDADDTYDPFADYSEFDEAAEEEADINFFRHGRFLTLGFVGGMRGFTAGLGQLYQSSAAFGLFLSYFFDLRFALQFSYNTSNHAFHLNAGSESASGTVGITNFATDLKYYVNTQNVTKGLAKFNPYLIGGLSLVDRTTTIENVNGFAKEGAMAFEIGAGIEMPMMRNKMFFGLQGMYQMINFQDKNTQIVFNDNYQTGRYPNGDSYTVMGILGVNF